MPNGDQPEPRTTFHRRLHGLNFNLYELKAKLASRKEVPNAPRKDGVRGQLILRIQDRWEPWKNWDSYVAKEEWSVDTLLSEMPGDFHNTLLFIPVGTQKYFEAKQKQEQGKRRTAIVFDDKHISAVVTPKKIVEMLLTQKQEQSFTCGDCPQLKEICVNYDQSIGDAIEKIHHTISDANGLIVTDASGQPWLLPTYSLVSELAESL